MLEPGPSLAELAAAEFEARRATASRKVAGGALPPAEAERHLHPWLALAARFGSDLPELTQDAVTIHPRDQAGHEVTLRRRAGELCPPAQMAEALAQARDAAIDRADLADAPDKLDRTRRLVILAGALGTRPYRPAGAASSLQKEAA